MKKFLISVVLATFLTSMPVGASEGREILSGDETEAIAQPISSTAPAFLQSIGIGRRRTVRRRRRAVRRVIRHRRRMRRRVIRNRGLHRGAYMRRSVRRRRHPRTMRIGIPRRVGVGVRRGRRY